MALPKNSSETRRLGNQNAEAFHVCRTYGANFFSFLARPALAGEAKVLHASGVKTARHCPRAPVSIFTFPFSFCPLRVCLRGHPVVGVYK